MKRVYIGVGSNLGLREKHLEAAEQELRRRAQIRFLRSSPVYETEPVGGPPQGKFLNAVWEIETELSPDELLKMLHDIERLLGRERCFENEPRTIDLDILFYDTLIMKNALVEIPHPRLHERWFALKPLSDLIPDFVHPVYGRSVKNMLENCREGR